MQEQEETPGDRWGKWVVLKGPWHPPERTGHEVEEGKFPSMQKSMQTYRRHMGNATKRPQKAVGLSHSTLRIQAKGTLFYPWKSGDSSLF